MNKLAHLNAACEESGAEVIVSGNIGCITHLQQKDTPVLHWIEIVDQLISQAGQTK
jgi:glycolate oxidase iron-sulfur subunit